MKVEEKEGRGGWDTEKEERNEEEEGQIGRGGGKRGGGMRKRRRRNKKRRMRRNSHCFLVEFRPALHAHSWATLDVPSEAARHRAKQRRILARASGRRQCPLFNEAWSRELITTSRWCAGVVSAAYSRWLRGITCRGITSFFAQSRELVTTQGRHTCVISATSSRQ